MGGSDLGVEASRQQRKSMQPWLPPLFSRALGIVSVGVLSFGVLYSCPCVGATDRLQLYPPKTRVKPDARRLRLQRTGWSAAVPWLLLVRTRCVAVLFCVSLEFGTATEATTLAICRDCWCDHLRSIIMIVRPRYYSGQFGRCVRQQAPLPALVCVLASHVPSVYRARFLPSSLRRQW